MINWRYQCILYKEFSCLAKWRKGQMLKRKIYDSLVAWKHRSCGKTSLLIDGARAGWKKLYCRAVCKKNNKSYIIVDFGNLPKDVLALFENDTTDFDLFFAKLSLFL